MIPPGTPPEKVTEEQIRIVANDVNGFIKKYGMNRAFTARSTGYSTAVISAFLRGNYTGNRGQVAIDLENWLTAEEHRQEAPQTTQFVKTDVAMEIQSVANFCIDHRTIGLIYGPDSSGIGKTMALKWIAEIMGHRRCALITVNKVDKSPTAILRKVASALAVEARGSNQQIFNEIVAKLRGRSFLLIIDQIHNLRGAKQDSPFYILTDLYDATDAAQLWCGTADLCHYLEAHRTGDESLAQIRRRICPVIDLMECLRATGGGGQVLVSLDQVREMFARNKLRLTQAAARFLFQIINRPDSGAVGLAMRLVQFATDQATIRGLKDLDVAILQYAMKRCLTGERAAILAASISASAAPVLAKVG